MYVSLTSLKPKGILGYIKFWSFAIPTFRQAQAANGNLYRAAKRVYGYQCTITAWENREIMLEFMRSGAHLKAMKAFHSIATGKTYGYESDVIPTWEEAYAIIESKGKNYL